MKTPRLSLGLYIVGAFFLGSNSLDNIANAEYWELFKNGVFFLMIAYMIWIYPKRKLYLNEDMMTILFIYFGALGIKSAFTQEYLSLAVGLLYTVGFIAYKRYRKKHKYSFYLKI